MKLGQTKAYQIFVHVAVVALLAEVYVLMRQNQDLKEMLSPPKELASGDTLKLAGLDPVSVDYLPEEDKRVLAYIFTPTCRFCRQNKSAWLVMADLWQSSDLSVIGISIDEKKMTKEYIADSVNYPVYVPADPSEFREQNKIFRIPKTILLNASGSVEKVWSGAITNEMMSEIASAISDIESTTNKIKEEP